MAAEDSVKALGTARLTDVVGPASPGPATAPPQSEQLEVSPTQMIDAVKAAVETLNARMKDSSRSLEFSMDEVARRSVIRVIDKSSGDIIRQLPNEDVLRAVRNIELLRGIIFEDNA
ncbi:MAG: flagellar protein FlaG [Pseudomonadota bacterium]|nr:flagellar protein FlaG [Pseudomonadota bacterium]